MYIADPYKDDGIWCISDEGANSNPTMLYSRPEAMPEFLFLGIDAELELLATFSQNVEAAGIIQLEDYENPESRSNTSSKNRIVRGTGKSNSSKR